MIVLLLGRDVRAADPNHVNTKFENEARSIGGEPLVDLVRYRTEVERNAYRETMDLCAGYVYGDNLNGGRTPGFSWAKTFGHGLNQPFSLLSGFGHSGLKSTYNHVSQIRIWHIDAWLRSVHTIYLVNSDGFKTAAAECLHTTDQNEIDRFAFAITGADILGSLVSGEALAATVGLGVRTAVKQVQPYWAARIPPRLARRAGQAALVAAVPILIYSLTDYFRDLRAARKASQTIFNEGRAERDRVREAGRRMLMARIVTELNRALESDQLSQFETWARAHVTATDREKAHADYARILARAERSGGDEEYRVILRTILPVLNQIQLD